MGQHPLRLVAYVETALIRPVSSGAPRDSDVYGAQ
jgi:hypothetical protein